METTRRDWDAIVVGLGAVAFDQCRVEEPPLVDLGGGQSAACWLVEPGRETSVPTVSEVPA